MDIKSYNQLLESSYNAIQPWRTNLSNTNSDLWPDYTWFNDDPLTNEFETSLNLQDLGYDFNVLPQSSRPPFFRFTSSISDVSPLDMTKALGQPEVMEAWEMQSTRDNILDHVSPSSSSEETSASTPVDSVPSSPQDAKSNEKAKKWTSSDRKRRSSRSASPTSKRQILGHNLVEKKYRNNLNSKINLLRESIPYLSDVPRKRESGDDYDLDLDVGESGKVRRCCKGKILDEAVKYIAALKKQSVRLQEHNFKLQSIVEGKFNEAFLLDNRARRGRLND